MEAINRISMAFIILHYQSLEDTINCIESILAMDDSSQVGIVVVDNASPNGTGRILFDKYSAYENIVVMLNEENFGFSRANNMGCQLARKRWNPNLFVVANNDIVFLQQDFVYRVNEKYNEYRFYIMGPDILNVRQDVHQSPINKHSPSALSAAKTIIFNFLALKTYFISYPFMRIWFNRLYEKAKSKQGFDLEQEDVCLQGACLIFSKEYVNERENVFYPETFFFAEEFIFTHWCETNNKKTVYVPDIKVLHNESSATLSDKDISRRIKFQMQNIYNATRVYYRYIKKRGQ